MTPWTVACQAPLSTGFPRQDTGVGCHFFLQRIFPTQDRTHISWWIGRWILDCQATWEAFLRYSVDVQELAKCFICISWFNSLSLCDKLLLLSPLYRCENDILRNLQSSSLAEVTQQACHYQALFPIMLSRLSFLSPWISMSYCCMESHSLGIFSAFCWQMIHRSPKLSIPASFQSWHHSPTQKFIKNLLWQIRSKLLSLTLNNHDNLTQSVFSISTLFTSLLILIYMFSWRNILSTHHPPHRLFFHS